MLSSPTRRRVSLTRSSAPFTVGAVAASCWQISAGCGSGLLYRRWRPRPCRPASWIESPGFDGTCDQMGSDRQAHDDEPKVIVARLDVLRGAADLKVIYISTDSLPAALRRTGRAVVDSRSYDRPFPIWCMDPRGEGLRTVYQRPSAKVSACRPSTFFQRHGPVSRLHWGRICLCAAISICSSTPRRRSETVPLQ